MGPRRDGGGADRATVRRLVDRTAIAVLNAWEAGAAEHPPDRAPSLLHSLGVATEASVEQMTVGQCDCRLFELRRRLFGDPLELVATCPACATEVELMLSLADIQPPAVAQPAPPITLVHDDYELVCRIPVNADLRALAALGDSGQVGDLVERCLLQARTLDGSPVGVGELPEAVMNAAVQAMAAGDPGAQTELGIRCPCGSEWVEELDVREILWTDLSDWVGRTLTEVHQLALSYGWSETEILAMGSWRRRWYLEAAGW
jgi:hypothetical protein